MPLAYVRLRLQRDEPEADPVYWTFGVDGASYDETNGAILAADTLAGITNAVGVGGSTALVEMEIDLVECFPAAGGEAYYVEALSPVQVVGTGVVGNHVVQCAVNALVNTPRGISPRGRNFIGPLATTSGPILVASQRTLAVSIMQEVAAAHEASVFTPVIISKVLDGAPRETPIGLDIIGWRADLRLDVLVSRRLPATGTAADFPVFPPA